MDNKLEDIEKISAVLEARGVDLLVSKTHSIKRFIALSDLLFLTGLTPEGAGITAAWDLSKPRLDQQSAESVGIIIKIIEMMPPHERQIKG